MSHAQLFFGFDDEEIGRRIAAAIENARARFTHEFGGTEPVGIDDVREIQRKALLSAGEGVQYFIIQKADHMTREAYNAFLKILEEPPRGSFFILVARSLEGIPETVLSRIEKVAVRGYRATNTEKRIQPERDETISFFESEIMTLKNTLEDSIRKGKGTLDARLLKKIALCMQLLGLLHTSNTSPRYIMDIYALGETAQ